MTIYVATPHEQRQNGTAEMRECVRRFLDRAKLQHKDCQWNKCQHCNLEIAGMALLVMWEEERG